MQKEANAPADTRMMGIVHSALRRDLERTRTVLSTAPYPDGDRRGAVADHVLWMMDVLHHHHTAEDAGLWPLMRQKNPGAGALLDQMDQDHKRIAPAITALEETASKYRDHDGDGSRNGLLAALAGLSDVLLPHLKREEEEMMPVVSLTLTQAEAQAVEQEHNIKPKSLLQLGDEGHWILDGLDEIGRDLVLHLVPAVPRFILVHGFAGRYRRKTDRLWGSSAAASIPSLSLPLMEGRA